MQVVNPTSYSSTPDLRPWRAYRPHPWLSTKSKRRKCEPRREPPFQIDLERVVIGVAGALRILVAFKSRICMPDISDVQHCVEAVMC